MTWKSRQLSKLGIVSTDEGTELTGNYIHLLIRAITGHLETKVFREKRSNAKIQVERETTKDVCIFSRVVFPFMIKMATI